MSSIKLSQCLIIVSGLLIFQASLLSDTLTVLGTNDIYGAGQSSLPATIFPGTFPPSASFAADPNEILTFSSVTGTVGCNFVITNGPDGTCFPTVGTTVTSYGGISGIDVANANMFLVGVFLDNAAPSGTGPSVLDYNTGRRAASVRPTPTSPPLWIKSSSSATASREPAPVRNKRFMCPPARIASIWDLPIPSTVFPPTMPTTLAL
jgi:hypothetical protein